jgi:hypothetical protein
VEILENLFFKKAALAACLPRAGRRSQIGPLFSRALRIPRALFLGIADRTMKWVLSPSIHKFANEFIYSGLSAEGAKLSMISLWLDNPTILNLVKGRIRGCICESKH